VADAERPVAGLLLTAAGMTFSLCCLLDLFFGFISYGGQTLQAGGFLGHLVASAFAAMFSRTGATIVASTLLIGILILGARLSIARTLQLAAHGGRVGAQRLGSASVNAVRSYRERAAAKEESQQVTRPKTVVAKPTPPPKPAGPIKLTVKAPPKPPAQRPPLQIRPPKQAELPIEPPGRGYRLPPVELLNEVPPQPTEDEAELIERAQQMTDKLREFNVNGEVLQIHPGPVVTIFEYQPDSGVKYSKITGMTDDLSLALRAESVRIDRMPGRSTVGVEVPNRRQQIIYPRDLFASEKFRSAKSKLTLALGKDISGNVFTAPLEKMPHLLVAGATGAGKSVGINGMIASILYKATPEDVRFIMIDTKMIELGIYADIPHLLIPVVTEAKHASTALKWAVREMENRYRRLATVGVRNLEQFNDMVKAEPDREIPDPKTGEPAKVEHLPYIVIVIDELADLMMLAGAEVEASIMRLAQMARAVGIHLIIATQRPSVDVITGTIKANFPARVAFRVSQRVDSRTIIDQQGAEHLLGRGDMLFLPPGSARLRRVHSSFITEPELHRITTYIKKMAKPVYDESILKDAEGSGAAFSEDDRDDMYYKAVRTVIQEGKCSITLLQRRLQLGYARAARIVDMMEQEGVVSPGEGSKPREILVDADFLDQTELG
jgi:S-DNA-T family DNA segregation ATPase FtsK/SpoIIIE